MNDQLLALVSQYGAPALFGIAAIAAGGLPLPMTLLLLIAGSMISQGAMDLWVAIGAAGFGSVLGDQAGYAIGRWGGPAAIDKVTGLLGKRGAVKAVEARARAWGGPGIYITRWLLSPLGPWVNLASGTAGYPWPRFLFWDLLGEFTGAALYIALGRYFSDRVLALDGILGDMTYAAGALIASVFLAWQLFRFLRRAKPQNGAVK